MASRAARPSFEYDRTFSMNLSVLYLSVLMATLVFLPNRFDVPYAVEVFGWEILPIELIVGLSPWVLLGISRMWRKSRTGLPVGKGALFLAFLIVGSVSTILSEGTLAPRAQGIVVLTTVAMWTSPFWYLTLLEPRRRDLFFIMAILLALACMGGGVTLVTSLGEQGIRSLLGERLASIVSYTNPRGGLPLGASTVIGAFYLMAIPVAYALAKENPNRLARGFGWMTVGLSLIGGMATASRSSIALMIFSTLMCALLFGPPLIQSRRALWIGAGVVALGVLGYGFLKLADRSSLYDGSIEWRSRGGEVAIEAIRDKPFLGHGMETVFKRREGTLDSTLFTDKAHDAIVYDYRIAPREPHNLYLLIGAETGLLGLVSFLALLGAIVVSVGRSALFGTRSGDKRLALGFLIGLLGVLAHSLSGSDLVARPRLAGLFWIYCGLAVCWAKTINRPEEKERPR